jgi:hypothetical protein
MTKKYNFPNVDDHLNGLLIQDQDKCNYWMGPDSLEKYEQSLKKMPIDWVWRSKEILYKVNSHGYRCDKDFNDIDWECSIAVFGCSNVFGVGVDLENTITGHIQRITNIPTINLGMPHSSVMRIWSLLTDFLNAGIKPKAIVTIWPDPSRVLEMMPNKRLKDWSAGNITSAEEHPLSFGWVTHDYQGLGFAKRAINSAKVMCKDIPYFDYTWFTNPDIDLVNISLNNYVDVARDNIHPGIETLNKWAEHVVSDMKVEKSFKNNV